MRIPSATSLLFIDLETVPLHEKFEDLDPRGQELWQLKNRYWLQDDQDPSAVYAERAGVMAEFSKVICATVAYLSSNGNGLALKLKSFYGDDEKTVLQELIPVLNSVGRTELKLLCAHNGIEFDFPFLARRITIHQLALPECLDLAGKKPWEVPHIDTMELWKFGDRKAYTSLNLLSYVFNIPSPKDDISGADVKKVYYEEKNLERIVRYCEKDVTTLAKIYLKFGNNGLEINEIQSEF
ncbi:ribonuclease H-like domain-containing protein [Luteibaculum oceani]|uniref:3'-5' exonuclease n=1 Tax=Luteibaculum oceani TaxID=1294296 RepID=A0A5C6VPW9_9FLAO|nr:ribonuclease H-like domain-containing protein [Luteibaculum oceani]TXC85428.1 3'-5' exonuclease [Luteibaculum oceani]